jgi:cation:H+ antiporter
MIFGALLFAASATVIAIAGWGLVAAADVIAERTRLGRAFLGMILIATVTSLPELSTGISAVTLANSPDIAVGAVVGSCVFNLFLFVLADLLAGRVAFYGRLRSSHNLTGAFGIVLLGLLAISVLAPDTARWSVGHVGVYSIMLAAFYLGAARLLYVVDVKLAPDVEQARTEPRMSLAAAFVRCVAASVVVVIAGAVLAVSGDSLATALELSDTFVGTLLVAAATSLPELVTMWAAVRLGTYDLAAGNLLGSNLFNMMLIVIYDAAYLKGPLLTSVSDSIAAPAVIAMVMTAVVVAAQNYVRRTKPHVVDLWAGICLAGLYLLNAWLLLQS